MAQDMNPRTCIVSKTEKSPSQMIRFVLGPGNQVFPDLKRKLPGRGVWVTANRKMIEDAIAKSIFSKGFKNKVEVDNGLPDLIEKLLRKDALQALMIAKKSGLVMTGQAKSEGLVRDGAVSALLQASNAGSDGAKKLASAIKTQKVYAEQDVKLINEFSSDELDEALSKTNTVFVALLKGGATNKLVEMIDRLVNYKAQLAE